MPRSLLRGFLLLRLGRSSFHMYQRFLVLKNQMDRHLRQMCRMKFLQQGLYHFDLILEDLSIYSKKAKAGLNRSILDKGWHQLEVFLQYKAYRKDEALFKISAHHTSQECAACGHTHPNNRKNQELFLCTCCGHSDNADKNAAEVIKKRAIDLLLNSGRGCLIEVFC